MEWWLGSSGREREGGSDVGQRVCGMVIGEWWLGERRRNDVGQRVCGMVVGRVVVGREKEE